ncbi:hypothetical protein U9M48_020350 [Paspalum notatum var. saurae]|uniref:Uncharacterized protein n=1 Tax=Paspalum notatum var. saurae TaxID=547442 RepID=A0AAQ3THC8_PASNO
MTAPNAESRGRSVEVGSIGGKVTLCPYPSMLHPDPQAAFNGGGAQGLHGEHSLSPTGFALGQWQYKLTIASDSRVQTLAPHWATSPFFPNRQIPSSIFIQPLFDSPSTSLLDASQKSAAPPPVPVPTIPREISSVPQTPTAAVSHNTAPRALPSPSPWIAAVDSATFWATADSLHCPPPPFAVHLPRRPLAFWL